MQVRRLVVLIYQLAPLIANLSITVEENVKISKMSKYVVTSIRTLEDFFSIYPLSEPKQSLRDPKATYKLKFKNNAQGEKSNLQIFAIKNKDAVLNAADDHWKKLLFTDLYDKTLNCKSYFDDCETSFLADQEFERPIKSTYSQDDYFMHFFTKEPSIAVDFNRTFNLQYTFEFVTAEYYLNAIYIFMWSIVVYNVYRIYKLYY